jgi:thioredoxin-related protein|tara:strand:- start:33701 stop:34285 length:585 start_codon:yes stop_codon:yes gene_type:complete
MLLNTPQMHQKYQLTIRLFLATLLIAWCAGCFAMSTSPESDDSKHDFFHTFSGSLPAELALLKKQNKTGLILFFSTQHCRFCQRMKKTVFNQASVQQYFQQRFQLIEIDIESKQRVTDRQHQQISYIELAKNHRVRLTPTLVFINQQGDIVYRHVGMVADPQEFLWLGEYVLSGQSSEQSFAAFKVNKRRLETL